MGMMNKLAGKWARPWLRLVAGLLSPLRGINYSLNYFINYFIIAYRLWRVHGTRTFSAYAWYLMTAGFTGRWEWWLKDFVPEAGNVAIDAGASFGQWSLFLAKRFKLVHAFEPHPATAKKLIGRAPANVLVHNVALWSEMTRRTLVTYADSRVNRVTSHELQYAIGNGTPQKNVLALSLDDLNWTRRSVDFIKMDVEGSESEVLKGGRALLERDHPRLLIEIHGERQRSECQELLSQLGYEIEVRHFPFYRVKDEIYSTRIWFCARWRSDYAREEERDFISEAA